MPNFKDGVVPIPSNDNVNNFSQDAQFGGDVYVYGKLYADINASDVFGDETVELKDLISTNDLFVSGVSTFIEAVDMNLSLIHI